MTLDQKRARIFGVLFLITFITSIPALLLYQPVLDDPVAYIAGAGHNNQIVFGALLELLLIIANIGTAVVIFPIVRRQSEELALGYVTARVVECTFILVGIVAVLGIVTLQKEAAGAAEVGRLHARRDQGLDVPARAGLGRRLGERADPRLPDVPLGLVPRRMTWLGLVGGPLIIVSGHGSSVRRRPTRAAPCRASDDPRALWELSLGIYCS